MAVTKHTTEDVTDEGFTRYSSLPAIQSKQRVAANIKNNLMRFDETRYRAIQKKS